jgi:thymidylate kinase
MPQQPPQHDPPHAKDPGPVFTPMGWLRLARNVASSWVGYLTAIRPSTSRGDLVVGDRWLYGYLVQPRPLRYGGPVWLARLAIALLPSPHLVVNLSAPVDVIRARKGELSREDIRLELNAWQHIPVANLVTVDMSSELEAVTRAVLLHLQAES